MPLQNRPIPSATVLVIRDSLKGLQVLMVERAKSIEFAGGALAFPGGKVTKGDQDHRLPRYLMHKRDFNRNRLTRQIAAVREAFEESGLLLLREADGGRNIPEAKRRDLMRRWRRGLMENRAELFDVLKFHNLRFDPRQLIPFAHWVTPEKLPIRFDTSFFLASAPRGQRLDHDGWEAVHALWLTPKEALEGEVEGRFRMMFPTRLNIERLSKAHSVTDAFAQARRQPVITVMPEIFKRGHEVLGRIPKNAGYGEEGVFNRII